MHQVGDRFTYGLNVLSLPRGSDDTAVIASAAERTETWQVIEGWPPMAGPVHDPLPLSAPITARSVYERGWELFLGFEIDCPISSPTASRSPTG